MKCGNCGCGLLPDSAFCPQCGAAVGQQHVQENAVYATGPLQTGDMKKKGLKKGVLALIAGICVLVLLVLAGRAFVKLIGGGKEKNRQVAYLKEGRLYYTPDVTDEDDAYVVSEIRFLDDSEHINLQYTEDGKYLYFYDRVHDEDGSDLCRIPVSKIKRDESKNENYIEVMDSKVIRYFLLDHEKLVYLRSSGELVYINGEDDFTIDTGVKWFDLHDEKRLVSYSKVQDEQHFDLYLFDLEDRESECIGKDVSDVGAISKDFVLLEKSDEDDVTLYASGWEEKEEEIAGQVAKVVSSDAEAQSAYYTVKRIQKKPLYDFVDDVYAERDEGAAEPEPRDYLSETTEQNAVSDEDYEYYFEDDPEERTRFYSYLDFDSDMNMYYYYNDDFYYEDENYLFYYDDLQNQWYSFDIQGYGEAVEAYEGMADRLELRQELKEETYDREVFDLYYYERGQEPVLIAEDIDESPAADAANQFSMYIKRKSVAAKVSIEDITDADDLRYRLSNMDEDYTEDEPAAVEGESDQIFYAVGTNEQKYKGDFLPSEIDFAEDGSRVAMGSAYNSEAFSICSLKDGALEQEILLDHGKMGSWAGDAYYYYDNTDQGDGDLCKYQDGEKESIARNVSSCIVIQDGNRLVFRDSENQEGILELYAIDGDRIKISNRAEKYGHTYIEEDCILYMNDKSLYVYTEKEESRRVDRNVSFYWVTGRNDYEAYIY